VTDWLSPKILAPEVHGAIGFGYLLAIYYRVLPLGWRWFALGIGVFWIVVTLKETCWDPGNEADQPFLWEGAKDLLGYLVGSIIAAAVVLVP
jgi:hypothetical protein